MIYPEKMTLLKAKFSFITIICMTFWFPYLDQKIERRNNTRKKIVNVKVYHDNLKSKVYKRDLTIYESYEIDKPNLKEEIGNMRRPIIKVSKEPEKSI